MKLTRTLSAVLAGAVLLSVPAVSPAFAQENSRASDPVIKVTFDDGGDDYALHGGTLAEGRNGNALSLSGDGQYADINGIAEKLAGISGDFTLSVWCNPTETTLWSRILDFGSGSSGKYIFLTPSSGTNPRLAITLNGNGSEQQVNSDTALTVNEWHNITITRENGTSTFYLDGLETGTTADLKLNFSDLGVLDNYFLGKSQFDVDPYFNGMIDDLFIYDYALDTQAVRELAAEAFEAKKNQLVFENNCYNIDVHAYSGDSEFFSVPAAASDMYVTDKSISDTEASFVLHNADDEDLSGLTAFVACYDENDVLSGLRAKPVTSDEVTSDSQIITVPYTKSGTGTKLFVWNDMIPLSDTAPEADTGEELTFTADIENYTASNGNVSMSLYAAAPDGTEQLIKAGDETPVASVDSEEMTLTISRSDIPAGTEKVIIKVTVPEDESVRTYTAGEFYCDIHSPVAAPADSSITTDGAHDPSIVKFPGDDTYYVYSSHHLIFTSKDLVNWTKYNFTYKTVQDISPETYRFIHDNLDTNVNGTYWAPDVIYRAGDAHPYWMYISVSCGVGDMSSAIALMKSDSPLFWADPYADIEDAGVVFATKTKSGYTTNAIDAHIYTDTDGTQYFIWGSFWGGIQAAPLTETGFVAGVDYTNDSTILSSCNTVDNNAAVFTQKNGVAGPEGAWMLDHDGYRYMFTSYGWLGSNYNTRAARSSLKYSFGKSVLKDANDIDMSTQYDKGSLSSPSGYKLIGSYRLGDGAMTLEKLEDSVNRWYDYYVPREADDAHVYYGPGHNSAITTDSGETFYVSHTRKDDVEIAATLQVRKMLWTKDGWPVVSPVTYAGEIEQALPKDMLTGTYDLASVGQTKMDGSSIISSGNWVNKNYDLPVLSSKVTLNADGTMADGLGTWTFDDDHTVTLNFAKDGDTSKDEFYKAGDVMTMYALFGYDKDEAEPVIALTGTDDHNITQFAKKSLANTVKTDPSAITDTEPVTLTKSAGGNPELGFDADGNIMYAGDPAATVIGDTVYLIAGHDVSTNDAYNIPEWVAYSSKDMKNWTYEGSIMSVSDISWRNDNTSAWASQMVEYKGQYYLYFCTWDKTAGGKQSIGVAVSDSPTGDFSPMDEPLISGTFTTPETRSHDDIDPTVLITTDEDGTEHRYLAWGNTRYYICELNEDMTSVKDITGDDEIVMHEDVVERKIKSAPDSYTEAPWLYERNGKFYLFYAMGWREQMAYAMMDDPMGRYDYVQTIMPPTATSNTNHPSVIDFNGKTYFIYHNGALTNGSGYRRSICIQELTFDEDGYVYPLSETSIGLTGTASVITDKDGKYLGHNGAVNPSGDESYPLSMTINTYDSENGYNTAWEIMDAKYVPSNENGDNYVSIQSVNKPGLYITADDGRVVLKQDYNGTFSQKMSFKTVKAVNGDGNMVSFESVSDPGRFLTVLNGTLTLSYGTDPDACAFSVGTAVQQDVHEIDPAEKEPDPVAEADIYQDFNDEATGTLISQPTAEVKSYSSYTDLEGVSLHIGARTNGNGDANQKFSIESGGVSGNMLVMHTGSFQSDSRGPRLQFRTPAMPNGYTVTASVQVKQGVAGSELRYNDSLSNEVGTAIEGLTTDWQTLKISITNNNDTYMRIITLGDKVIAEDYSDQLPVLWGSLTTGGQQICFDDLSITTVDTNGETPELPEVTLPEPAAYYSFDETLEDSVSGQSATLTGSLITEELVTDIAASFVDRDDGTKAVSFTGEGSYGLALPSKPDDGTYTISFDAIVFESTQFTPYVFMINYDGESPATGDTTGQGAQWVSILPVSHDGTIADAPKVWSRLFIDADNYPYVCAAGNGSITENTWHNITVSVNGDTCTVYVDKKEVVSGSVMNIINETTRMYVGVNAWDTPLNGAIDNLRLYNEALTSDQVKLIGAETAE